MKNDCRAEVARLLVSVSQQGQSLNNLLAAATENVREEDRSLFKMLCFGSLRFYHRYLACLNTLLEKPLKKKDSDLLHLLIIGCYQLEFTRIPAYAAINSCVEASRALGKGWAKGLVNAVLRNFQRQTDKLDKKLEDNPVFRYSHPEWIIRQLKNDWPANYTQVLEANNVAGPMTLRVNALQATRPAYLQLLEAAGIKARATQFSDWGIQLENGVDVHALPGFARGMISVQDEAAQLAAVLLKTEKSHRVLDACCAPGGKTGHLLETGVSPGHLLAIDSDKDRLSSVQSNLDRLGFDSARLIHADATNTDKWWDGQMFDRILLDAPCSASGVIRRHPDIKLLRKEKDITTLSNRQSALLKALWKTLKPGGVLLYATCSVFNKENDAAIGEFLQKADDALIDSINSDWGCSTDYGKQLFPDTGSHDGFYYSRLIKRGEKQQ
ncbi:MAG: 16S rRNA (cytosine(967)-C(5))-methyltransferase RsmB [Pseudomonadales bacterium]|nr:16S rRNA (cytosine(967)-C(5))-methyltransferase RsmB [Pseudomonadales bacterium]